MGPRLTGYRLLPLAAVCAAVALATGARPAAQGDLRERTLFVTVVDRMDNPIEGLGAPDFMVREDGVQREVLRVSRATEPIDVAVLVDNASSSTNLIPRVRVGLKTFIASMTPRHSVAVIALADRPTILADYTTDSQSLLTATERLFTMTRSGMTLLDGLVEVSDGMRRRESARAAIVPIVTDGMEYSNRRHKDVTEAVRRSGAALHPITVGQFAIVNAFDPMYERTTVLAEAPGLTGGRRHSLLSSNAIEYALTNVARQLNSQYKLVYSRPETLIPPENIEVSSRRAELTVHATPARAAGGSEK
jgi:VWFA-related protein